MESSPQTSITLPNANSETYCNAFTYSLVEAESGLLVAAFLTIDDQSVPVISLASPQSQTPDVYKFKLSVVSEWHTAPVLSETYSINMYDCTVFSLYRANNDLCLDSDCASTTAFLLNYVEPKIYNTFSGIEHMINGVNVGFISTESFSFWCKFKYIDTDEFFRGFELPICKVANLSPL
jgi:hypothetical protein